MKLSDRYEIASELGRGGMGVVYLAHDPLLNREVAVKLVPPEQLTPESEQRFQAESQLVAQMDHPSIVSIFDFGIHDGSMFFVMPVVRGKTLRQSQREGALRLGDVLEIGIQVAEALAYSHDRGVIHRDIKPDNIMVSGEDTRALRVRVMDFGLARDTTATRMTKSGVLMGTMAYLSPEQAKGSGVDGRSDLYSLGTVLYECLANTTPFTGEMQSILYRIVHELPQPPSAAGASVDRELDDIILACLAKDPAERIQKASELAVRLRKYRDSVRETDRLETIMLTQAVQVQKPALAPFVGRTEETKVLQQHLNAAVAGDCQFVVIAGEPGIGKSRLVDEIEALAKARGIRVLHGRLVEQDGSFPYHGFCEAIQEYFRQKESGSISSGEPDFSDLGAGLVSLFPMLSEIDAFRSNSSDSIPLALTGVQRTAENRTEIFEMLARTLTRIAAGKPLVLCLNELHEAEGSLDALQYIVRRLGPTPTLIIGTYRSTEVDRRHPLSRMLDSFQGDPRFEALTLGPLSRQEHDTFLATLVGGKDIGRDLAERIFESSEGNPFFTKELVRSLLDAGGIVRDDTGRWTLSVGTSLSSDILPETIQQAVEKRLAGLPEELRKTLSIGAVIGKSFDFSDLEELADDEELDDHIDTMVQQGLIEEDPQSRGDRLTFCSGVVREVLYAELSRRKRRTLHRKHAAHLEKRHTGRLERVYPQLVHHFAEGDVPEKTVEYALLHAKRSLDSFSPDEAIRSVKTALEFLDDEWGGEAVVEGEARMLLASAYQMSGHLDETLNEVKAAVRIFQQESAKERSARALLMAARAAWQARRTEEARRYVEQGLEVSRDLEDDELVGHLLPLAATLANLRGDHQAAKSYSRQVEDLKPAEKSDDSKLPRGGRLCVALANPVSFSHPANALLTDATEVLSNVFETLLSTDAEGNVLPALCQKWEVQEEGTSILLSLRPDVKFQDGHPLDAQAVKESFESSVRAAQEDVPAVFEPIQGVKEFLAGDSEAIAGLVLHSALELEVKLSEALSFYPALLAEMRGAIARQSEGGKDGKSIVGTGPFMVVTVDDEKIVLERNPDYWRGTTSRIDSLEFRHGMNASAIATALRSEDLDVAGDLLPEDLDEILRDRRFRDRLVEVPRKAIYYCAFNCNAQSAAANETLRGVLCGVVRTKDLVWQTLGRFAIPALGFLPPGVLGHDPGRRSPRLSLDAARAMLQEAGIETPLRLRASIYPVIQDQYGVLLKELFAVWGELGVEVVSNTKDLDDYMRSWKENDGIDLAIGRWTADYDDPDDFTQSLFHSRSGKMKAYYCSDEADEILQRARREHDTAKRGELYRSFENLLLDTAVVLPLFHDVLYRIVSPKVLGVELSNRHPYVNYMDLARTETARAASQPQGRLGGVIRLAIPDELVGLDPAPCGELIQGELLPSIYETLTRDTGGGRIEGWLAKSFHAENGGRRYRFRLREGIQFHDGSRLTARDVRYTFERLMQDPDNPVRGLFSVIKGSRQVMSGERKDLEGIQIRSSSELTIDLERPLAYFPALVSFTGSGIVPEGSDPTQQTWNSGACGTGPFRVVRFEPGRLIELERNPLYWRPGYPRSRGLIVEFNVPPAEIASGFREGRYAIAGIAGELPRETFEALGREPRFAAGYRQAPSLSTVYMLFNINHGCEAIRDRDLRRRIVSAIDVDRLAREGVGQGLAVPANGIIPPGLPGHETRRSAPREPEYQASGSSEVELRLAIAPKFAYQESGVVDSLTRSLASAGVRVNVDYSPDRDPDRGFDMRLAFWGADYVDADTFVRILHTHDGIAGKSAGTRELDDLIDRASAEVDPEVRHSLSRQIEATIKREVHLLPLYHQQAYRFARPELENLSVSYWVPAVAYEELYLRD